MALTFRSDQSSAQANDMRTCWRSWAKAVRREWGEMACVATLEKTPKGCPVLLAIVASAGMARDAAVRPKYVEQWVKDHAAWCGFGHQTFVEVARNRTQVAGFVAKLEASRG